MGKDLTAPIDVNGYVAPAMELVYERGSFGLRGQWLDVERRLSLTRPLPGFGDWTVPYLRLVDEDVLVGDLAPPRLPAHGGAFPDLEPGLLQDRPDARLRAMDAAGIGTQLVNPGPGIDDAVLLPPNLAAGVFAAYNQYVISYCGEVPQRLCAVIQVHGMDPQWSAREVRELATNPAVAAVTIHLPVSMSPTAQSFDQLWTAVEETGLPVLHRPGAVSRIWSGPRHLLTYLGQEGVFDRYEGLRFLFVGRDAEWVKPPSDSANVRSQAHLEALFGAGRGGVAVIGDESDETIRAVAGEIGEECILWQSGFPFLSHPGPPSFPLLDNDEWRKRLQANAIRLLDRPRGRPYEVHEKPTVSAFG